MYVALIYKEEKIMVNTVVTVDAFVECLIIIILVKCKQ